MHQAKLLFVAMMLMISVPGCSDSTPKPVQGQELTPQAIAEQEAILNEAAAAEDAERKKNKK